jgi:hypothetical protein
MKGFTPEAENEIYQRFSRGYNKFKDKPELREMIEGINIYRKMLKLFNIEDD